MPSSLISDEQLDQLSEHTTPFLATVRWEVTSRKLGNITTNLNLFEGHAAQQIRHFLVAGWACWASKGEKHYMQRSTS